MDEAAIVEASRREHALYGDLVDAYASLARVLAGDAARLARLAAGRHGLAAYRPADAAAAVADERA